MSEHWPAFQIAAYSKWNGNRWFNVFVEGRELFFIHTTAPRATVGESIAEGAGFFLGPFGVLLTLGVVAKQKRRLERLASQPSPPSPHPSELLIRDKHSYRVHTADIEECRIVPRPRFTMMNEHVAHMTFRSLGRSPATLLFEAADQVDYAIRVLRPLLGSRLEANLHWDYRKNRFQTGENV